MISKDPSIVNPQTPKLPYQSPTLVVFGQFNAVTLGGINNVNGDGGGRNTKT